MNLGEKLENLLLDIILNLELQGSSHLKEEEKAARVIERMNKMSSLII